MNIFNNHLSAKNDCVFPDGKCFGFQTISKTLEKYIMLGKSLSQKTPTYTKLIPLYDAKKVTHESLHLLLKTN